MSIYANKLTTMLIHTKTPATFFLSSLRKIQNYYANAKWHSKRLSIHVTSRFDWQTRDITRLQRRGMYTVLGGPGLQRRPRETDGHERHSATIFYR